MPKSKKKKEPPFKKVEDGMILVSKNMVAFGLPIEVEKKISIGGGILIPIGGKAKGEEYSKIKYGWISVTGSPLPFKELEGLKEKIAATSGTFVASLDNAVAATITCKKCGTLNLGSGKFCSNCGNPL